MGLRGTPSQRQKRLGQELRKLREASGLPAATAGRRVGLSQAHMSHIESGRTACPEARLRELASLYGCKNQQLIDALAVMSTSDGKGWWSAYKGFTDERLRDLAELESSATAHRSFQWLYIPGLLQTAAYMRALFSSRDPAVPTEDIDRFVKFRLRRQEVLSQDPLPMYHAIIHEAAFHMHFVDRTVMRDQLEYLVELSHFPNVQIQLLPFKAETQPATPGAPFTVFDAQVAELHTVYVEHPVASVFLGDENSITRFSNAFQRLSKAALAPLASVELHQESSYRLVQHLLYIM